MRTPQCESGSKFVNADYEKMLYHLYWRACLNMYVNINMYIQRMCGDVYVCLYTRIWVFIVAHLRGLAAWKHQLAPRRNAGDDILLLDWNLVSVQVPQAFGPKYYTHNVCVDLLAACSVHLDRERKAPSL